MLSQFRKNGGKVRYTGAKKFDDNGEEAKKKLMERNTKSDEVTSDEVKLPFMMISERNPKRMIWDISLAFIIVFYAIVVPLRICFEATVFKGGGGALSLLRSTAGWSWFDAFNDIIFGIDIIANFRTTYITKDGVYELDEKKVALKYLKSWFFIDFIASIPLGRIIGSIGEAWNAGGVGKLNKIARMLRFVKIAKLFRVLKLGRVVTLLQIRFGINGNYFKLFSAGTFLLGVWHYIACVFWYISYETGFCDWGVAETGQDVLYFKYGDAAGFDNPNGFIECLSDWVPWASIIDESLQTQYTQAFFWAVMITTGVGKDVAPETNIEVAFTIIIIFAGVLIDAFIIGTITNTLAELDAVASIKREKLEAVNQFLRKNRIKLKLKMEINDYYDFFFANKTDSADVVSDLPHELFSKMEVTLKLAKVESCDIFAGARKQVLMRIIEGAYYEISLPKQILTIEKKKSYKMYIVQKGTVSLFLTKLSVEEKWQNLFSTMKKHRMWIGESSTYGFTEVIDEANDANETRKKENMAAYGSQYLISEKPEVEVERVKKNGKQIFFGEFALFNEPHFVSSRTLSFCEFMVLNTDPERESEKSLLDDPAIAAHISNTIRDKNPLTRIFADNPEFFRHVKRLTNARIKRWRDAKNEPGGASKLEQSDVHSDIYSDEDDMSVEFLDENDICGVSGLGDVSDDSSTDSNSYASSTDESD